MSVRRHSLAAILLSASLAIPVQALAGGFYLQELSPKETGRAMAGAAAAGDDPSTVYFNPAAMTNLPGIQTSVGGVALMASAHQANRGSSATENRPATLPILGFPVVPRSAPITGTDGGNPFDKVIPIPSFYATAQLSQRLWLGIGVNAPFGLKLDYGDAFFGRYDSVYTDLKTYNIQPSLAYKLTDSLSVGGGVDVQYVKVTLTNAVPNPALIGVPFNPPASSSFLPGSMHDLLVTAKGHDWSFGWNAGLFYTKGGTNLGIHYRSRMTHRVEGDQTLSGPSLPSYLTRPLSLTAPLDLPDIVTVSMTHSLTPRLRAMLTGRWYNWSRFKNIAITTAAGMSVKDLRYHDSYSASVGGEYDVSPALTLRAGTMFDRTPTNKQLLTTRVPDGDRVWLTGGATWNASRALALNLSYAHVFVAKADIVRIDHYSAGTAITRSQASGNADQIAASLTARF